WPTAKQIPQQNPPTDLDHVKELWPKILKVIKERRRFAWILLDQNAQIAAFDGKRLLLRFSSAYTRSSYCDTGVDALLEDVIRHDFKLSWTITATIAASDEEIAAIPKVDRRIGEWPTTRAVASDTQHDKNASGRAGERTQAAWPPVARFDPQKSTSRMYKWPSVLEEVKRRRSYAWFVLNDYATVKRFDEKLLTLEFEHVSTLRSYHESEAPKVLASTLLDIFGYEYEIEAVALPF
ncbi:hypothetical protein ACIOG8_09915, partial [Streptomyces erythrochromogenes]